MAPGITAVTLLLGVLLVAALRVPMLLSAMLQLKVPTELVMSAPLTSNAVAVYDTTPVCETQVGFAGLTTTLATLGCTLTGTLLLVTPCAVTVMLVVLLTGGEVGLQTIGLVSERLFWASNHCPPAQSRPPVAISATLVLLELKVKVWLSTVWPLASVALTVI